MPKKLHLKRTPAEQAKHDLRKSRKAARRAARRSQAHETESDTPRSARKRQRTDTYDEDSDASYGPHPPDSGPSNSRAAEYEEIRARVEEQRFREKMWDAAVDDERLHTVEARLNDYAHVPKRWRGGQISTGYADEVEGDPVTMDDEEYAEWVRAGMWRRKNAAAIEEEQRQQAAHLAAQEAAARELKAEEKARKFKRWKREQRREVDARVAYDRRWSDLLALTPDAPPLRFDDIPWPIAGLPKTITVEQITGEAISTFLAVNSDSGNDEVAKARKDRLRETMLRFHPDKFEGRVLKRVRDEDREAVMEGAGAVVRAVTTLMATA